MAPIGAPGEGAWVHFSSTLSPRILAPGSLGFPGGPWSSLGFPGVPRVIFLPAWGVNFPLAWVNETNVLLHFTHFPAQGALGITSGPKNEQR